MEEEYKSNLDSPIYFTVIRPKCRKCIHFIGFPKDDWKADYYLCKKMGKAPNEYYRKTEHGCPNFVLDERFKGLK